jgi:hypothetical protein
MRIARYLLAFPSIAGMMAAYTRFAGGASTVID